MSDVIPTIDVMPMTTPSTVSAERILLARSVSHDMTKISDRSPARTPAIMRSSWIHAALLAPQGLDRIEPGRPHGRVHAEEEADHRRDADADCHRPDLDRRRQRRHLADDDREDRP